MKIVVNDGEYLSNYKDKVLHCILKHERTIIDADTGIGKTALFMKYIDPNKIKKNIIFCVPFISLGIELVGSKLFYDGKPPEFRYDEFITATVVYDTMAKIPDAILEQSIVIIDEGHILAHSGFRSSLPFIFDKLSKHKMVMLTGTYIPETLAPFDFDGHIKAVKQNRKPIAITNYLCEQQIVNGRIEHRDEVHINFLIDTIRKIIKNGNKAYVVIDNAKIIEQVIDGLDELNCIYRVGKKNKQLKDSKAHDKLYNNGHVDNSVDVIIGTNVLVEGLSLYSKDEYEVVIAGNKSSLMLPDRIIQVANRQRNIDSVKVHIERYIGLNPSPKMKQPTLKENARRIKHEMLAGVMKDNRYFHFEDDGSISPLHKVKIVEEKYSKWAEETAWTPHYQDKWLNAIKAMAGDGIASKVVSFVSRKTDEKEVLIKPQEALLELLENDKFDSFYMHPKNITDNIDNDIFKDVLKLYSDDLTGCGEMILVLAQAKYKLNRKYVWMEIAIAGTCINNNGIRYKVSLNDVKRTLQYTLNNFTKVVKLHGAVRQLLKCGLTDSDKIKKFVSRLPKKSFGFLQDLYKSYTNIKRYGKNAKYDKSIGDILAQFGLSYVKSNIMLNSDLFNIEKLHSEIVILLNKLYDGIDKRWQKKDKLFKDKKRTELSEEIAYWDSYLFE